MGLIEATTDLEGRAFLLLGLGGLGKTYLELLDKLLKSNESIYIIDRQLDQNYIKESRFNLNVHFVELELTKKNYQTTIERFLSPGDVLLNFSNTCDSQDLISYCLEVGLFYQDTAWGWWKDENSEEYSLYEQDQQIQKCKKNHRTAEKGFALVNFGINPGLISMVAKNAISQYKSKFGTLPDSTNIYFTEFDAHRKEASDEKFVCTWSPFEFWSELRSPSEFYLRPSFCKSKKRATEFKINAWSKTVEIYTGFLVPHREVFSFVNSLNDEDKSKILFTGFCYHPPQEAFYGIGRLLDSNSTPTPKNSKVMTGYFGEKNYDEIGVLIGANQNWIWSGYSFHLSESPMHCVSTNSTLFLVAVAALCGLLVSLRSGKKGVLEAEDLDTGMLLDFSIPLIGEPETMFPKISNRSLTNQFEDLN